VLEKSDLRKVEAIIIDGYVILDNNGKSGLGGHLFKELNENIPIIGVAKTSFRDNSKYVKELYRGLSKNPLFITSKGMTIEEATDKIRKMKGNFRIPSLLTRLDRKTKE
jgi:deoxyinosine 3'endonuclease (endonuclease V)